MNSGTNPMSNSQKSREERKKLPERTLGANLGWSLKRNSWITFKKCTNLQEFKDKFWNEKSEENSKILRKKLKK